MLNICKQWNKEKSLDIDDFHESMQVSSGGSGRGTRRQEKKKPLRKAEGRCSPQNTLGWLWDRDRGIGGCLDGRPGARTSSRQMSLAAQRPGHSVVSAIQEPGISRLRFGVCWELYTNSDESLL